MSLMRKYGAQTDIYFPTIKRDFVDLSGLGEWSPDAGDIKISSDGAAAVNVANVPVFVAGGWGGGLWKLTLAAVEMQAHILAIVLVDNTPKMVEDQVIIVETYGSPLALHAFDLNAPIGQMWDELRINHSVTGSFADQVLDKAGYSLSPAGVDAIWDEARSAHNVAGTFGEGIPMLSSSIAAFLAAMSSSGQFPAAGTCLGATANTITLGSDALLAAPNMLVSIISGTGAGQTRLITAISGVNRIATITGPWVVTPDSSSVFVVLAN